MALRIVWTKRAKTKFDTIIEYLLDNWGKSVTSNFVRKTHHIIELISEFPEIGFIDHIETEIRGFAIVKQAPLFL